MRKLTFTALLLVIIFAGGCSRSGDFGLFLVTEVKHFGGHTITKAPLQTIDAHWTAREDSNGFTARVNGVPFATVDSFMRKTFGPPKVSADTNLDGQPQRVWATVDVGVAIQCIGRSGGAEIICLKGW